MLPVTKMNHAMIASPASTSKSLMPSDMPGRITRCPKAELRAFVASRSDTSAPVEIVAFQGAGNA